VRTVALLLASLVVVGIAVQRFGYGRAPRSHAATDSAAQTEAEHSLTLLDVWAQSVVPSMLIEHSRPRAARLTRRLRIRLRRAESFETDLMHDRELRAGDSIDARALQDAASAWHNWALALLRLTGEPSRRSASRIAALEARAVRLHQTAYAVVDASLRAAVTER
jgi:hypothetical protein